MQLRILRDGAAFVRAFHLVLSWMLLAALLILMLAVSYRSVHSNWAGGAWRLSPVSHSMPEEDFANLWAAGRLVRAGHLGWLYTAHSFQAWRQLHFGAAVYEEDWIYPPTVLLVGVPLSFLPLLPGFLLWDAATLAIAVILLRQARLPWPIIIVGLAGPATWRSLALGQYGVITGALVVAGLLLAPRRPARAGLMLGLATLKPQQGAIVPVAWIAARNWPAFAAAAGTFAVMAATITIWLGGQAWVLFFTHSSAMARGILDSPPPQPVIDVGLSVFWMFRTFGTGIALANLAQIIVALAAMLLVYRAWRLPDAAPLPRMGVTVCLSLLVTPYGYTSDMVGYSIALATVLANKNWRLSLLDVMLWTWPFWCTPVTVQSGLLLTPLCTVIAAARCWRQMTTGSSSDTAPSDEPRTLRGSAVHRSRRSAAR